MKSIDPALHNWMVDCLYSGDYHKAFRIQRVIDKGIGIWDYIEFMKGIAYPLILREFVKAQEGFKLARGVDETTYSVDRMSLAEKRFDMIYGELKKIF